MLLNQTAVYGLRAIATLASLAPGETLNAAALSSRTGVPQQYLSKVMRKLVLAKLVQGRRGHGGGFSLMRAPRDITLGDVLAAVDQAVEDACVFGYAACDMERPCALHPIWSRLKESITKVAVDCTMADIDQQASRPARRAGRR